MTLFEVNILMSANRYRDSWFTFLNYQIKCLKAFYGKKVKSCQAKLYYIQNGNHKHGNNKQKEKAKLTSALEQTNKTFDFFIIAFVM